MKAVSFTLLFLTALGASMGLGWAETVSLPKTAPMPEMRPSEAPQPSGSKPRFPALLPISKEDADAADKLCKAVLAENKVIAEPARAAIWDNGCGAIGQITISAIKLKDGGEVLLRPSALIRCETAEVFADWVREDLVPATAAYGGIARIDVAASYHCRPRNNLRGARLSEHGRANAIDIRAIATKDGRRFGVDLPETPINLLSELRRSSCARFTTVLGPGSDGFHEDHFHLDLAQRRGGFRMCQWNLPTPPDPLERPLHADRP